jgi:hypothetical protein
MRMMMDGKNKKIKKNKRWKEKDGIMVKLKCWGV